ncbi:MAG: serine/threonine protein kinase [Verrucomicrobiales bacterium]|jgi:serine/threonine protein kinase
MVRKIGEGSYGEVWLAHSLTGARRAVKIVRRQNFDSAKSFEREFEGIQHYEPISRGHPSLLPILHVGRSPDRMFYYYIMEAADPVSTNGSIYSPLTLETQGKNGAPAQRKPQDCWQIGRDVAEGLGQLHKVGLIHRDVKPSNVILVNGKAKLADLGLVTSSGRRTFVGTEGYVAPEGPGAPQSDVYSLGMVLYELVTGMDRMDFPELPDEFDAAKDKTWWELNSVICKACATERGDRYADGMAMANAMSDPDEAAKRRPVPFWLRVAAMIALLVAAAVGILGQLGLDDRDPELVQNPLPKVLDDEPAEEIEGGLTVIEMVGQGTGPDSDSAPNPDPSTIATITTISEPEILEPPPSKFGSAKIISDPDGAQILDTNGKLLGQTPLNLGELDPGPVQYVLHLEGHRDATIQGRIRVGKREVLGTTLTPWAPPEKGNIWVNSLRIEFQADGPRHVAGRPITEADFARYLEASGLKTSPVVIGADEAGWDGDPKLRLISLTEREKQEFCDWLAKADREGKQFGPGHFYTWNSLGPAAAERSAFVLIADRRRFGVVQLFSEPLGAEVFSNGESLGHTPLMLSEVAVGRVTYELRMRGYEPFVIEGEVEENEELDLGHKLDRSQLYLEGEMWTNSLGMRFAPLKGFACGIWETRVRDFETFAKATERERHHETDLPQTEDHPVVNVSRTDGIAFCAWLTEYERQAGRIDGGYEYRLPTDLQWSEAAGLQGEGRNTPEERDKIEPVIYPWGEAWPPPTAAGNFAASKGKNTEQDGFEFTSPVGTFEPRENGVFDLSGNVWEWVLDSYGGEHEELRTWGVTRGGSWSVYDKTMLITPYRNVLNPERRESIYGFRVVIVPVERAIAEVE